MGKIEKALEMQNRAVETAEKVLGRHPTTAEYHSGMAILLRDGGRIEDAKQHIMASI